MNPGRDRDESVVEGRPALSARQVLGLIWASYMATAPYLFLFLILFGLALWLVTEVIFR
jgi:hypothetical protein